MKTEEKTEKKNGGTEDRSLVQYRSRDGQEIRLSFEIVRKFLVSGHPEFVGDAEILLYMGMCKSRGLNPFKRDCYLLKYTKDDPAATIVSIDYYRSRAKAQEDCVGWRTGVIVRTAKGENELREGSLIFEGETLLGGWFRARPRGWEVEKLWTVGLKRYLKTTREGKLTRFWQEDNQSEMICKVVESQGLRRVWPDEFAKLYIEEEIVQGVPIPKDVEEDMMPKALDELPSPTESKAEEAKLEPPKKAEAEVPHFKLTPGGPVEAK